MVTFCELKNRKEMSTLRLEWVWLSSLLRPQPPPPTVELQRVTVTEACGFYQRTQPAGWHDMIDLDADEIYQLKALTHWRIQPIVLVYRRDVQKLDVADAVL